jgi:hypothetical protein
MMGITFLLLPDQVLESVLVLILELLRLELAFLGLDDVDGKVERYPYEVRDQNEYFEDIENEKVPRKAG